MICLSLAFKEELDLRPLLFRTDLLWVYEMRERSLDFIGDYEEDFQPTGTRCHVLPRIVWTPALRETDTESVGIHRSLWGLNSTQSAIVLCDFEVEYFYWKSGQYFIYSQVSGVGGVQCRRVDKNRVIWSIVNPNAVLFSTYSNPETNLFSRPTNRSVFIGEGWGKPRLQPKAFRLW